MSIKSGTRKIDTFTSEYVSYCTISKLVLNGLACILYLTIELYIGMLKSVVRLVVLNVEKNSSNKPDFRTAVFSPFFVQDFFLTRLKNDVTFEILCQPQVQSQR